MGLLIRQGKHKDDKPLVSDYELAQITKISEITDKDNEIVEGVMNLELTILTEGAFKGKKIFDRVPYDPNDTMAWKYKTMRRHAGCPYDKSEPEEIDIEALILNKAVGVKLSIYTHKDGRLFQNVSYVAPETNKISGAKTDAPTKGAIGNKPSVNLEELEDLEPSTKDVKPKATPAINVSDEDFPF